MLNATIKTYAPQPLTRSQSDTPAIDSVRRPLLDGEGALSGSETQSLMIVSKKKPLMPRRHPLSLLNNHELLNLLTVRDIKWLAVCEQKAQPFFFMSRPGQYAVPLSSRLQLAYHFESVPSSLRDIKEHLSHNEGYRLSYLDPIINRVNLLEKASFYRDDDSLCAALNCLVRVGPLPTAAETDAELVCTTVAAVCFSVGFLVRRNPEVSKALKARISDQQTQRAFHLTKLFCEQNDLAQINDYLDTPEDLFDGRVAHGSHATALWLPISHWPKMMMQMLWSLLSF